MSIQELAAILPENPAEETLLEYDYPLPRIRTNFVRRFFLKRGVPKPELYRLDIFDCARSPQSHVGPYFNAIDFLVPDGTLVFAAQDGRIVEIKQDSDEWGDGTEFRDKLNYVTITHDNGEFSQYCHILKDSVSDFLAPGSLVSAGQVIAKVGKNGWTDRDHLHFIVFKKDNSTDGFKSLKIRFKSYEDQ